MFIILILVTYQKNIDYSTVWVFVGFKMLKSEFERW